MTSASQPDPGDDRDGGLPPELEKLFKDLTGGAEIPPEVRQMLAGSGLGDLDPTVMASMAEQMKAMFSDEGGQDGFDDERATTIARQVSSAAGDPVVTERATTTVREAVRTADLWLDEVTDLAAPGLIGRAWSRAEWVEATMPRWADLVEPVADGVSHAVGAAMGKQLGRLGEGGLPEGLLPPGVNPAAMMGQMDGMLRRLHGNIFSAQAGQAIGHLATEVLTGCEPSLPLVASPSVVLVPHNVEAFARDNELEGGELTVHLAAREAARVRLFHAVPWLGPHLLAVVRDYARGIVIDTDAIEAQLATIDPSDPAAMSTALEGRLFAPPDRTPAQQQALTRLEATLALVEGWVDTVTARAVAGHLPNAGALDEIVRRRRAAGGPAEKTFGALVGLELRPRRLRDAVNLFAALEAAGGATLRDRAWSHPDVAPGAADLDDPLGYVERLSAPEADDFDAELESFLRGEGGSEQDHE
ncbi:MAG TPA: zinc-dependent metalloprotease [Phycicoccus elongatus]|nr:zinc-dependent metalloprotease [Phycicoccus elongatus]